MKPCTYIYHFSKLTCIDSEYTSIAVFPIIHYGKIFFILFSFYILYWHFDTPHENQFAMHQMLYIAVLVCGDRHVTHYNSRVFLCDGFTQVKPLFIIATILVVSSNEAQTISTLKLLYGGATKILFLFSNLKQLRNMLMTYLNIYFSISFE